MKFNITLVVLTVLLIGVCAVPVWSQGAGTVKGVVKDEAGKPIADATVEFTSVETGRKVTLKTDKKGEFLSVGVPVGKYNAIVTSNGQVIDTLNGIPVTANEERSLTFDLAKDKPQGPSAEQAAKIAKQQKENENIKNLNATLQNAKQLEQAGNWDQAVAVLKPVAEANPDKDLLWAYLADAYRGDKKYPEAAEAYQKAIAIKPTGAYHNGLADTYAKSGQTDKAIAEYNLAIQAEPTNAAMYYYNEGAVYTNAGKIDEAVGAFDKCIQADPNRADCYYQKGVAMLGKATMKGDKMVAPDGTAEAFNKYLELQPDGKNAQSAKDLLASIGATVQTTYGKGKTPKK